MDMKRQRGFTLIELMITVVIISIVAGYGVPNLLAFIQGNRLVTQTNEFVTALHLARSEAVKRSSRVTVCASQDGLSCSGAWQGGWIVFADDNNDASFDAGEDKVRVREALSGENTLSGSGNLSAYVSYVSTGFTKTTSGDVQSGTFVLCDSRGISKARAVTISATGRPSSMSATAAGVSAC